MTWHTGRTVGVTLYRGDGPADMVGVMVGPHDAARLQAARVVACVNGVDRLAAWIMTHVSGELSRSESAVDVAIRLLSAHYPPAGAEGGAMSTEAQNSAQAALRGSQGESEHILTAVQVAAIGNRKAGYSPTYAGVQPYINSLVADVAALVAQDGRWRALVGELLSALVGAEWVGWAGCFACGAVAAVGHAPDCYVAAVIAQAQAALADAPPAPRGAAE